MLKMYTNLLELLDDKYTLHSIYYVYYVLKTISYYWYSNWPHSQ